MTNTNIFPSLKHKIHQGTLTIPKELNKTELYNTL